MRKFSFAIILLALFAACSNDKKTTADNNTDEESSNAPVSDANQGSKTPNPEPLATPSPYEKLLGSYVGAFGDNKITLLITRADKDSVAGRSIVGGNDRPFTGTLVENENGYSMIGKEPGNDPNDGVFTINYLNTAPETISGSWKPNNTKKPAKEYSLQRRAFQYRPEVGAYPQASQRLLTPKGVENEMKEDLEFMRNEIFARHGFCFNRKHLRQQFENEDWYIPNTVNIKGFLTDIEKKNIEMIRRYEKYADEYGDEYGR